MNPYIKISKLNMDNIPGSSIDLSVAKGEIIGITGVNGCGKSTLAKYLAGMVRPNAIGRILINGLDPYSQLDRDRLNRMTGIVYQDPREGRVFENVGRDMVFGAENEGVDSDKLRRRAASYIKRYDLRKKQSRAYGTISGSEEQRVAICGALMMRSELLILDEPFSMQTEEDADRFSRHIIAMAQKIGQTLIIFTKQRKVLQAVDRAYEMVDGSMYEIDAAGMPLERIYVDESAQKNSSSYIDSNRRITVDRYIYGGDNKSDSGISLHNISFGYDDRLIIDNVNVRYEAGSAYRISGPAGSGKTTYLKLIGGLIRPYEGEIFIGETQRIGYVFQYSEDGFVENTVLDEVMFGPMSDGESKRVARDMATAVLNFVGVRESLWDRSPLDLSFGEQRLVSIAAALAVSPDFLLIDEPYAGLDHGSRQHIESIIKALCREGKCIITVEG